MHEKDARGPRIFGEMRMKISRFSFERDSFDFNYQRSLGGYLSRLI